MTALINRIIDYSGVDGPGNRLVLVFQGCNFRCRYCHTPDTMGTCNGCGVCVLHCSTGALRHDGPGTAPCWIREKCVDCGSCTAACQKDATPRITRINVKEALDLIKERRRSIRGITCSGGECTLYAEFMASLFPLVRKQRLSCLIDTNGSLDFEQFPDLLKSCDGVMLDIKALDPARHLELTGADNGTVLRNAVALAQAGKLLEVRTLVTAADYGAAETVDGVTKLLKPYLRRADITYRLIPFRVYGVRREYRRLGQPPREMMEELRALALANGFTKVMIS